MNAKLLTQAGFINQEMAGVYSFLPLGLRVLTKIENIVREEMNAIGGQEILMPAFSSKEVWEKTDRWESFDVLFKVSTSDDKEIGLNPTHEETVTPLVAKHARSYKDLPFSVYQIQTKFRNEPRAKSGLLRGREFRMKDMYSFDASEEDRQEFYKKATKAYHVVFDRLGLGDITHYTYASGGAFTDEYSHEFQTLNKWGEDMIHLCACGVGYNDEIFEEGMKCKECGKDEFEEQTASEVGNIFPLGTRFSDAFGYKYTDKEGKEHPVVMGCYGIGPSRTMGVIAEVLSDDAGLVWPASVAPYTVNIIPVGKDKQVMESAEHLYNSFMERGIDVMLDDRDMGPGAKFKDNDLIGIPYRIVVSEKTLAENKFEFKRRTSDDLQMVDEKEMFQQSYE
ncbi:MAG: aminoacyl--tRNA ligase-related protein [Candidatus Kerfeldbacteria bacterium]